MVLPCCSTASSCQAFYYNVENLLLTNESSIDLNNTNFKFIYEVRGDW
jgi:hypothetical protein